MFCNKLQNLLSCLVRDMGNKFKTTYSLIYTCISLDSNINAMLIYNMRKWKLNKDITSTYIVLFTLKL